MKLFFTILFSITTVVNLGQSLKKTETPYHTIKRIFTAYIKYEESVDSDDNKAAMTRALAAIQLSAAKTELNLLINVWLYYDPTDYPTRTFVEPVFKKYPDAALLYIDKRIKNKKAWEDSNSAPLADLIVFKQQLQKMVKGN
jgi:hypothetical protein